MQQSYCGHRKSGCSNSGCCGKMSPLLFNYHLRADDCSVDPNEELVESGTSGGRICDRF